MSHFPCALTCSNPSVVVDLHYTSADLRVYGGLRIIQHWVDDYMTLLWMGFELRSLMFQSKINQHSFATIG